MVFNDDIYAFRARIIGERTIRRDRRREIRPVHLSRIATDGLRLEFVRDIDPFCRGRDAFVTYLGVAVRGPASGPKLLDINRDIDKLRMRPLQTALYLANVRGIRRFEVGRNHLERVNTIMVRDHFRKIAEIVGLSSERRSMLVPGPREEVVKAPARDPDLGRAALGKSCAVSVAASAPARTPREESNKNFRRSIPYSPAGTRQCPISSSTLKLSPR